MLSPPRKVAQKTALFFFPFSFSGLELLLDTEKGSGKWALVLVSRGVFFFAESSAF